MTGLLLRLGGPMQSWGSHSTWADRDTHPVPTRSALIGLFAAAAGIPRQDEDALATYRDLQFRIRLDRPGHPLMDFHTVGGGRERTHTVPTASGSYRPAGAGTVISNRHYLSDAVFSVAVTSPRNPGLVTALAETLRAPYWAPYLGRRACPADMPLLLGVVDDPAAWLHERLPLPLPRVTSGRSATDAESAPEPATVTMDFVADERPEAHRGRVEEISDEPMSFDPINRAYRLRPAYWYSRDVPDTLCAGLGPDYLTALATALENHV